LRSLEVLRARSATWIACSKPAGQQKTLTYRNGQAGLDSLFLGFELDYCFFQEQHGFGGASIQGMCDAEQ
jgi:hypothetical protein